MMATSFSQHGLLLVTGVLRQQSSLAIGGELRTGPTDTVFSRDGARRPTLRGGGLAGAAFAAMRKAGWDVPPCMSSGVPRPNTKSESQPSVVTFWSSHPTPVWHHHLSAADVPGFSQRQHQAIRHDTGAGAHQRMFDAEVLGPGHEWPVVIEVDLTALQAAALEAKPDAALSDLRTRVLALIGVAVAEWQLGRCWLGEDVAAGQGWMQLVSCQAWHRGDDKAFGAINQMLFNEDGQRRCWASVQSELKPTWTQAQLPRTDSLGKKPPAWRYHVLRGTCTAGPRADGWGLDSFFTASHGADRRGLHIEPGHLHRPKEHDPDITVQPLARQRAMAMLQRWDPVGQKLLDCEPHIQGSTLRGPLRHGLSAEERRQGRRVQDPSTGLWLTESNAASDLEDWFGKPPSGQTAATSSRVLVRDLLLTSKSVKSWKAIHSVHHAEDDFRAGLFADATFGRYALVQATFEWEIVIEAPPGEDQAAATWADRICRLMSGASARRLALGGGVWAGHGRLQWTLHEHQWADAGSAWPSADRREDDA